MSELLDARGLSCPQPVIMIRKAMANKEGNYRILVDNMVSVENITRYAQHEGYLVSVTDKGDDYLIECSKQ